VSTVVLLAFFCGCNTTGRQPQFKSATITPAQLKPGDNAVITADVKDRHNIIRKIEGVVQEDPSIKLKLNNEGVAPDAKAGDNLWSLQVAVPFQAPPGSFLLQLTAYRADGTPVPVKTKGGKSEPLTATVPVVIQNPNP
jgi:hypothetical protein